MGSWLKGLKLFKLLLEIFHQAETDREDPLAWNELIERLSRKDLAFGKIPKFIERQLLISSFIALVGFGRETRSGKPFPLVPTQIQLWIRELRRLGRIVSDKANFIWLDEPVQSVKSLPAFFIAANVAKRAGLLCMFPMRILKLKLRAYAGFNYLTIRPPSIVTGLGSEEKVNI